MSKTNQRRNYHLRTEIDHLRALEAIVRAYLEEFDLYPDRYFAPATVAMAERSRCVLSRLDDLARTL